MSKLNAPRTIPYDFKVVAVDGWVWLYDDSERTYICSATPTVFMEALYPQNESEDGHEYAQCPDPNYFDARDISKLESVSLELKAEEVTPDIEHDEAWDMAREEAHANYRI
jgi:hypothetical protein